MKRLITKRQEEILRCCHQDFYGLTQMEAAKKLDTSQSAISDALTCIEKIMPQMFPILTKLEAKCYHLYMNEGWSVDEITEHLNQSTNAIYKTLQRAKDKGMYFTEAKGRILQYEPSMDAHIKQQF